MDWYCGYIQLHHDDLIALSGPTFKNELSLNPVFSDFYGDVTFFGVLSQPVNIGIVAGFDTAHPGMEDVTLDDCIEALTKTVDRLEKTIHGGITENR